MIDGLGAQSESRSPGNIAVQPLSQQATRSFCWKLQEGMQQRLWQLSPQGGGLSYKLIERSHMIAEFHLEPSRYIKLHRNEKFTEVPLHFPKSPHITCVIVTLSPLLPHLCTSCKSQRLARAHPGSITTLHCLLSSFSKRTIVLHA